MKFDRAASCTVSGGKESSSKWEEQAKEAKNKQRELEGQVAKLRAELASVESKGELMVERKALQVELKMRQLIEEAYEKGFNACKNQFLALKQLQSELAA